MTHKQELSRLLEELSDKQKKVSQCHAYYGKLEKEFEKKRQGLVNPEDCVEIERELIILNREYEEKSDLLMEELNAVLMKGHALSQKIGNAIAHDFEKLWDYMTQPMRKEVELDRVLRDIDYIKKEL